jgi:hypothetical protein
MSGKEHARPITKRSKADEYCEEVLATAYPDLAYEEALRLIKLNLLRLPKRLRGRCGAWARSAGRPCVAPAMPNGRCRRHGGLSTGPTSEKGREIIRTALRQRWVNWRDLRKELDEASGIEKQVGRF